MLLDWNVDPPLEANELLNIVWRLQRAMYGSRDAAAAWELEKTRTLNGVGFESGVGNPSFPHCEKLDPSLVVHGHDFST